MKTLLTFCLALMMMGIQPTSAQNTTPCSDPGFQEFQFWVGKWNVMVADTLSGTNEVTQPYGDCLIMENWEGVGGYSGKSFNTYNMVSKKWNQVWVDNQGNKLEFEGEYKDDAMLLWGETIDGSGNQMFMRMTFTQNSDGTLRQHWETSIDLGKTWTSIFDGKYVRQSE